MMVRVKVNKTPPPSKFVPQSRASGIGFAALTCSAVHALMLPRSALSLSRKRVTTRDVPVALYSNGIFLL